MGVGSEDQESTQIPEVHRNESTKKKIKFNRKICDFCLRPNHLAWFCRAKKKAKQRQQEPKVKTE